MNTCAIVRKKQSKINETDDVKNMDEEVHQFQRRVVPKIFLSNIMTILIFLLSFYDYLSWKIAGIEG